MYVPSLSLSLSGEAGLQLFADVGSGSAVDCELVRGLVREALVKEVANVIHGCDRRADRREGSEELG